MYYICLFVAAAPPPRCCCSMMRERRLSGSIYAQCVVIEFMSLIMNLNENYTQCIRHGRNDVCMHMCMIMIMIMILLPILLLVDFCLLSTPFSLSLSLLIFLSVSLRLCNSIWNHEIAWFGIKQPNDCPFDLNCARAHIRDCSKAPKPIFKVYALSTFHASLYSVLLKG